MQAFAMLARRGKEEEKRTGKEEEKRPRKEKEKGQEKEPLAPICLCSSWLLPENLPDCFRDSRTSASGFLGAAAGLAT